MLRSYHQGSILLLEGSTDKRIFENFTDSLNCKIVYGNGKDNTIDALEIIEKRSYAGVLAVVDADFWRLDNVVPLNKCLFITDTHDIETMILSSLAFDKFIREFCISKVNKSPRKILELLIESGLYIGFLRWFSSPTQSSLDLKFQDLNYELFISDDTLKIDIKKLIKTILSNTTAVLPNTGKKTLINETVLKKFAKENLHLDKMQICHGKDLINILSIGIRKNLGKEQYKNTDPETISGALRLSYEFQHFKASVLYKMICDWENNNKPYKVFSRN
jgi:hypothetical protein